MQFITIRTRTETIKINLADICYIISHPVRPHYVQIITEMKYYDLAQNLSVLEQLYSNDFVRCHRNCLVNISKIKSVDVKSKVVLLGDKRGHRVAFSRRKYQDVLKKWLNKGEK